MSTRRNHPNESLRSLMREAGLTNHNLAQAVNRVAGESCVDLTYDRTTVSHWLSGSRPRPPVPDFIAEALSRRLGRPVTISAVGLAGGTAPARRASAEDPAGTQALFLLATAHLDAGDRATLREVPYRVDWASAPGWPAGQPGGSSAVWAPRNEIAMAGPDAVAALRATTATLELAHRKFGRGRLTSAAYLATDVTSWLEAGAGDRFRGALLGAVAELTCLIGAMCVDDLHHHLAQRYYRSALALSVEAGDLVGYLAVVQRMSTQAWFLGHHRHAVALTESFLDQVSDTLLPATVHAGLLGRAAVAHAALSDRRAALDCLARAERRLGENPAGDSTEVFEGRADLAHRIGLVRACARDWTGAEAALRRSLRHRAAVDRRWRMLTTDLLAKIQLRGGRFEQACATWGSFLDDYPHMESARIRAILLSLHRKLSPHRETAVVADTIDRIDRLST
ncbi:hypothetical protein ABZ816_25880 [Actinosynnema sp. NPDC047251]|uniref:Putative transcriptional regulator n=1 Tax=Saccharothrix espanaensis (strain ATCC 51144 / DSM 44229 / JCM 9112 / NBRC 15066 / NRRL 15764) TaxID=1179773 RepID=K0K2L9_SACES|nr:hypothetical protein [Saccharothrix espanaensis]CCH31837.1 putative transcriptional regulator [Saccharothrix espanaensis DSM 44229]